MWPRSSIVLLRNAHFPNLRAKKHFPLELADFCVEFVDRHLRRFLGVGAYVRIERSSMRFF